jgi:hypothetical protein
MRSVSTQGKMLCAETVTMQLAANKFGCSHNFIIIFYLQVKSSFVLHANAELTNYMFAEK